MPVNAPAEEAVRGALSELQGLGAHLVLASGKPCLYLSGLARGLDIMAASVIGENGAETWVNSTMPPQRIGGAVSAQERDALRAIADWASATYGSRVFLQPNAVGVTVFPAAADLHPDDVAAAMNLPVPDSIVRYVHVDSVDWAVARFNKGAALEALGAHLGVGPDRLIAVGDSDNDVPMLQVARAGFWVGDAARHIAPHVAAFPDIRTALAAIVDLVGDWAA